MLMDGFAYGELLTLLGSNFLSRSYVLLCCELETETNFSPVNYIMMFCVL